MERERERERSEQSEGARPGKGRALLDSFKKTSKLEISFTSLNAMLIICCVTKHVLLWNFCLCSGNLRTDCELNRDDHGPDTPFYLNSTISKYGQNVRAREKLSGARENHPKLQGAK